MSLSLPRPFRWPAQQHARVALLTLVALALFVAIALWTQWARDDLDWVQATLSLYLQGPWGRALRTAYCVLALAIMLLAVALHANSRSPRRSAAAPLLAPLVHGLSANTAFLCVSVAMLLQSWYLRADPRWRTWAGPAWWWAWLCFVLLWLHVLWRGPPRGAGQKLVIAVVLVWLVSVAWQLWRQARRAAR